MNGWKLNHANILYLTTYSSHHMQHASVKQYMDGCVRVKWWFKCTCNTYQLTTLTYLPVYIICTWVYIYTVSSWIHPQFLWTSLPSSYNFSHSWKMDSRMGNKPVAPPTLWAAAVALLLSQNLVVPVMSFEDQKNYYAPTPPTGNSLFFFLYVMHARSFMHKHFLVYICFPRHIF